MNRLKIAIQKSGRLNEDSLKLLKDCGIRIDNGFNQLKVAASNFAMDVFFLRNSDIPQYLEDGVVDVAILGENLLIEEQKQLKIATNLVFSKCKLSIATPKGVIYNNIKDLEGKKIATSYPNTLKKSYLDKNNVNADLHIISGSVEIAPNIGLADAICDLVSSGNTLFKNDLEEKDIILKSEACLSSHLLQ